MKVNETVALYPRPEQRGLTARFDKITNRYSSRKPVAEALSKAIDS